MTEINAVNQNNGFRKMKFSLVTVKSASIEEIYFAKITDNKQAISNSNKGYFFLQQVSLIRLPTFLRSLKSTEKNKSFLNIN